MFIGTALESKLLLVDTQADGTAIKYDWKSSKRNTNLNNPSVVKTVGGAISG